MALRPFNFVGGVLPAHSIYEPYFVGWERFCFCRPLNQFLRWLIKAFDNIIQNYRLHVYYGNYTVNTVCIGPQSFWLSWHIVYHNMVKEIDMVQENLTIRNENSFYFSINMELVKQWNLKKRIEVNKKCPPFSHT